MSTHAYTRMLRGELAPERYAAIVRRHVQVLLRVATEGNDQPAQATPLPPENEKGEGTPV